MWYLIVIVSLTCWVLFKIVRDFTWSSFNKQIGFSRTFYYNKFFLYLEATFLFFFNFIHRFTFFFVYYVAYLYEDFFEIISTMDNKIPFDDIYRHIPEMGIAVDYFLDESPWLDIPAIIDILSSYYVDSQLFAEFTPAYYYYTIHGKTKETFLDVQRFNHNTAFEFVWASFPAAIIALLLFPSLFLLYTLDVDFDPKLTVKVIGHQWFWSYEFDNWIELPNGDFEYVSYDFDSSMVVDDYLEYGDKRLLEVDNPLIVPVNVSLRFLITSADVLHSWSVPELGVKIDAVPGRISQFLSLIRRPGFFYGQCSELCGVAHAFMPIVVIAV